MFPEWSPGGADIAYISGGTEQLATVSGAAAPGSTPKVLSAPDTTASDISWVPRAAGTPMARSPATTAATASPTFWP